MLAFGPKYVPKCQSQFSSSSSSTSSFSSIQRIIEREYQMMSKVIRKSLADNCVSASDERANLFFTSLKDLLMKFYTTKLPRRLFRRARQDHLLTKQIQRQLRDSSCCSSSRSSSSNKIILRRTDKSKVFHLGSDDAYQEKAVMYMKKTNAYEEVKNEKCPLADNLSTVVELLDKLLKRKAISEKQYSMMKPKKDKVELGHLYFLPKPHKVRSYTYLYLIGHHFENIICFVDLFIGWYTIETYYLFNEWSNHWCITFS
jgi:hypothetical protein